jgi:tetratricopeptide (TPR) repeat protein
VVDDLRARGHTAAFFSFWAQSESQKKNFSMLSTLVWQLLKKLPNEQFDDTAARLFTNQPTTTQSLFEASDAILNMMERPVYLVIDALDESSDDWTSASESGLQIVRDWAARHSHLRVLLLGRGAKLRECLQHFACLELTPELVHDDVARLVATCLDLATNIEGDELRSHVRVKLAGESTYMFLWVKLVFKELQRCFSPAEVKAALESIPKGLDEEYHRLFKQLVRRTSGSAGARSPSIQMQRARRLFALILGAAEPLTIDELRHAYAISTTADSNWRDHLLSRDGILDVCGDFIHISSDRIHLCHSSVREFLTRPREQWIADEDVSFFRIELFEDQRVVGLACLDYLSAVDWGYPLNDDSFLSLSQRHPFLLYAQRYFTFHILQAKSSSEDAAEKIFNFLESIPFCKWIEHYVLHALHDYSVLDHCVDFMECATWLDSTSGRSTGDTYRIATRRMGEELVRRQRAYGDEDARTIAWTSVGSLIGGWLSVGIFSSVSTLLGKQDEEDVKQISESMAAEPTTPNPKHAMHELAQPTEIQAVAPSRQVNTNPKPQNLLPFQSGQGGFSAVTYGTLLLRTPLWTSNFTLRLDHSKLFLNMLLSAAERLPVLVVVMLSSACERRGDSDVAMQLCKLAAKRVGNHKSFEEAVALGYLGDLYCHANSHKEGVHSYQMAAEIMRALPRNLHNDVVRIQVNCALVWSLYALGDFQQALAVGEELADLLSKCGAPPAGTRAPWEKHARRAGLWSEYRMRLFLSIVEQCREQNYNERALCFAQQALGSLERSLSPSNVGILSMRLEKARILDDLHRYAEAADIWQGLVKKLDPQHENGLEVRLGLAQCHFKQGQCEEALKLLQKTKMQYAEPPHKVWHIIFQLASVLTKQGSLSAARKELSALNFVLHVPDLDLFYFDQSFEMFYRIHWGDYEGSYDTTFQSWFSNSLREASGPDQLVSTRQLVSLALVLDEICDEEDLDDYELVLNEAFRHWNKTLANQAHGDLDTVLDLGWLLKHEGRYNEVIELSVRTIATHHEVTSENWEKLTKVYVALGNAHRENNNMAGAVEAYHKLADTLACPNLRAPTAKVGAQFYSAEALHMEGDLDGAVLAIERALKLASVIPNKWYKYQNTIVCYGSLGQMQKKRGNSEQATEAWETARQLSEDALAAATEVEDGYWQKNFERRVRSMQKKLRKNLSDASPCGGSFVLVELADQDITSE